MNAHQILPDPAHIRGMDAQCLAEAFVAYLRTTSHRVGLHIGCDGVVHGITIEKAGSGGTEMPGLRLVGVYDQEASIEQVRDDILALPECEPIA